MFFEDGWIPLSEITADVFRRLQTLKTDGKIGKGQGDLGSILALTVWDICEATTKLGVTAPGGNVVSASRDLVMWSDPTGLANEHVHLQTGSVGSSDLLDEHGDLPGGDALIARYGAFLNLPLVIPVNAYQSSIGYMPDEVREDLTQDRALIDGARTILSMVESGEMLTRELARSRIGTSLTRRKFKLAWSMAAAKVPELKNPNRWIGL